VGLSVEARQSTKPSNYFNSFLDHRTPLIFFHPLDVLFDSEAATLSGSTLLPRNRLSKSHLVFFVVSVVGSVIILQTKITYRLLYEQFFFLLFLSLLGNVWNIEKHGMS
jgi:hypothetical protein